MLCRFRNLFAAGFNVHRHNVHLSAVRFKRRKTDEEKNSPRAIQYSPKSKWKQERVVQVWKDISVKELAKQLDRGPESVFEAMEFVDGTEKYKRLGDRIDDLNVVKEILKKCGCRMQLVTKNDKISEEVIKDAERRDRKACPVELLRPRPPVVTIMGHVDHGKTTLLDRLRESNVVETEFGGITQHVGAFSVVVNNKGERITFLDTPGHAAFSAMRARGARCTDIVVLVVAADDGPMPQTLESISAAQEAGVPIIVALNKIDKQGADVIAARKRLTYEAGLQLEGEGGDVQVVEVSALVGTNVKDGLVDAILAQAELMELKADYTGPAEGVVVEATLESYRGRACTLLIDWGTLKRGSVLVAGTAFCKVRAMMDDSGNSIVAGTPSMPVFTLGWRGNELPSPGEPAIEVESEKRAHEIVEWRQARRMAQKQEEEWEMIEKQREEHYKVYRKQLEAKRKLGRFRLKPTGHQPKETPVDSRPRLSIVLKGDVEGSLEAILDVLETYDRHEECSLDIVHYGVGPVTISDVTMAATFSALIFTFNTGILPEAKTVRIKTHNVIYKLVDDLKSEISSLLPMREVEEVVGEAVVLQEFKINEGRSKVTVAGCRCTKGLLKKSAKFRLLHGEETLFDGTVVSIRHLKNEVESIKNNVECGLRLSDPELNFKPGDTIQCYVINYLPSAVDWDPGF
ncbi:hypothetical protein AAG570_003745 [Ranatra chinensis]|uniref:Translation initiation factor IF-2, mitochondrial n=1 Tax=Ranatra chinensis TaxID=642074 RepID=A0ABD0Y4L2_9HEMI